jgi:KipI family sensor histidine kinase inhibitor
LRDSGDWLEVIPGIDSVVLQFDAATYDGDDVRQTIESALAAGIEPLQISQSLVEIPVIYGGEYGPDLNALCEKIGMSADDVIALHTGREYTVDMIGFTPGFAFIGNLDERLRVPRRKEPRQRVEAGSVGIADERTGLYAMASPGGWTIIGRTPSRLFDPNAEQPFVLGAGTRVRFTAISADELNG